MKSIRDSIAAAVILMAMLACGDGETVTSVDDPTATLIVTAYLDHDDDGTFGWGDAGISGAHASLLMHATGDTVARAQSTADGIFAFTGLAADAYRVEVELGSMQDSLVILSTGNSPIVLAEGDTVETEVRVGYTATVTSLAGARALPIGQRVIVSGVALTRASLFGDSTLHLSDASGSIRVIDVSHPVLAGDSVRLMAAVAARSGQPVLAAISTTIERTGVGVPAIDSVSTADAADAAGGVLDAAQVAVSGTVAAVHDNGPDGTVLTIDDGSGALLVELRPPAGFTAVSYDVGEKVRARGVLVPGANGSGWRLRPRRRAEVANSAGVVPCSSAGLAGEFPCRDVDLVAFLSIADLGGAGGERLNDIWGWTDPVTGREYAIVGRSHGTSFVDISDPVNAMLVANLPMTAGAFGSMWRDMKVYRDHVYVVSDNAGAHGMQVVDLTRLREFAGTPLQLTPDALYIDIASAHNLVINEESGFAYAVGASSGGQTCGGGLHMIDIREPKAPQFAGCFADLQTGYGRGYTHDAQCVTYNGPDQTYSGREICFGSNATALSIADVTDRTNPQALARAGYPDVAYSHQAWLTEDQRYLYMNDELDENAGYATRTRTLIWDVADLEDPQLVAQHMGVAGSTDHNLYIRAT